MEYIVPKIKIIAVSVHPIGGNKNAEGKELAEMYDMKTSGAIALVMASIVFNRRFIGKALQYVKAFDGMIINCRHIKALMNMD